jgi:hypothetical protein
MLMISVRKVRPKEEYSEKGPLKSQMTNTPPNFPGGSLGSLLVA